MFFLSWKPRNKGSSLTLRNDETKGVPASSSTLPVRPVKLTPPVTILLSKPRMVNVLCLGNRELKDVSWLTLPNDETKRCTSILWHVRILSCVAILFSHIHCKPYIHHLRNMCTPPLRQIEANKQKTGIETKVSRVISLPFTCCKPSLSPVEKLLTRSKPKCKNCQKKNKSIISMVKGLAIPTASL